MALFPEVGRQQPKLRFAWWLLVAFLLLGILLHLFPFYFMLITSFKEAREVFATPPTWWPQRFTTAAWKLVYNIATGQISAILPHPFWVYLKNSLILSFGTLLISLPVTSLAA